MNKLSTLLFLFAFACFAAILTGCDVNSGAANNSATLTMRSYNVPQGRAEDLSDTLNHLLRMNNGKQDVGSAWVAAPGQILVLAPTRMQESIADSIKNIINHEQASGQAEPLRLNAWLVDAYPGQGEPDPALKSIQPALKAFSADMGVEHFTLANYFTAVSNEGSESGVRPLPFHHFDYEVSKIDHGLLLKFNYGQPAQNGGGPSIGLHGQITTQLGQTIVLGIVADRPENQHTGPLHKLLVIRIVPTTHS